MKTTSPGNFLPWRRCAILYAPPGQQSRGNLPPLAVTHTYRARGSGLGFPPSLAPFWRIPASPVCIPRNRDKGFVIFVTSCISFSGRAGVALCLNSPPPPLNSFPCSCLVSVGLPAKRNKTTTEGVRVALYLSDVFFLSFFFPPFSSLSVSSTFASWPRRRARFYFFFIYPVLNWAEIS